MKKLPPLALLVLVLFFSSSAYSYSIHSAISCGKFITWDIEDKDFNEMYITSWFAGYATAVNMINDASLTMFDSDSNYYAILNHCKENPLDDINAAAFQLYVELYNKTK